MEPRGVATVVVGPADKGFLLVPVSHHHPPKTSPDPAQEPATSSGGEDTKGRAYLAKMGAGAPATAVTHRHLATHTAKEGGTHPRMPLAVVVSAAAPPEVAASSPERTCQ
jgi:hypothetical protein